MKDGPIIKEKPRQKNRMQLRLILFLLIVLFIITALPYYFFFHTHNREFQLRTYTFAVVDTRTFTRRLNITGTLEPEERAVIRSPLDGVLGQIQVETGQEVQSGALLAIIETRHIEEEIQEKEEKQNRLKRDLANLEIHREIEEQKEDLDLLDFEEKIEEMKRDVLLKEKLYQLGTIPFKDLEEAKKTLTSLQAQRENTLVSLSLKRENHKRDVELKEEELKKLERDLSLLFSEMEKRKIVSPINGLILSMKKEDGENTMRNDEIFHIINLESSRVILKVNENDVIRLREGQKARVNLGGSMVQGEISYLSPKTERGTDGPVIEVHISLEEIPPQVRAYSTAVVEFELTRRENIPYLPRGDYLTSGEYSFVYLIHEDKAKRVSLSYGAHEGSYIEILSGLKVGDMVITSSYEDFKERREILINQEGGRPH